MVKCGKSVVYLTSLGRSTDIGIQLDKALLLNPNTINQFSPFHLFISMYVHSFVFLWN